MSLGDIGKFLKEGGVANLDWLDVDEEKYRKEAPLPKQNLDIGPDLQALWAHEDKSSTFYLEPNTGGPRTMGDLSEAHGKLRAKAEDILKTARFALMMNPSTSHLKQELLRRFTMDDLRANRSVLASAIQERGLLGKAYIDSNDFPNCHNSPKVATAFVRKHAGDAKYVIAKPSCGSCIHAKTVGSKTNCAVFHKELVPEISYTEQYANEVERREASRGKQIQASSGSPKDRVRLAILTEAPKSPDAVYSGIGENQLARPTVSSPGAVQEQLIAASSLLRKKVVAKEISVKAGPIVAFLRREMLKGRTASDLAKNLKVAFPIQVLTETRSEWEPIFKESGLFGNVYSTQEAFDECREGADFLAKHNPGVRAIVQGSKCDSCVYHKVGRCLLYGKPVIKEASDIITWETVDAVVQEHKLANRLQPWETKTASWGGTPGEALKALHNRVLTAAAPKYAPGRLDVFHAWSGGSVSHVAGDLVKRDIVKTARRYLNEGLYGNDLLRALKAKFEVRDLQAATEALRPIVAEHGLQGIFFVDPSVYEDYGHGCKEASTLFRSKQVPYVKLASKCGSCVHNTNQHCGQLNKPLVSEPPYVDKTAQQKAVLASGNSTQINEATLMAPSGLSMIQEFQLQNDGSFELAPEPPKVPVLAVELGTGKVKL